MYVKLLKLSVCFWLLPVEKSVSYLKRLISRDIVKLNSCQTILWKLSDWDLLKVKIIKCILRSNGLYMAPFPSKLDLKHIWNKGKSSTYFYFILSQHFICSPQTLCRFFWLLQYSKYCEHPQESSWIFSQKVSRDMLLQVVIRNATKIRFVNKISKTSRWQSYLPLSYVMPIIFLY